MGSTKSIVAVVAGLLITACRVGGPMRESAQLDHAERGTAPISASPLTVDAIELVAEPKRPEVDTQPKLEVETEATPEPEPFAGRERVRVDELITELDAIADQMAEEPTVRADYEALLAAKGLTDSEALFRDYVRVKLAFEATRDGGFWHLRWDITNEKPNSEQIWRQWGKAAPSDDEAPVPTAIAECDELSALFAFVAHKLGVRNVGLLWPQWNHVVAVWTVQSEDGSPVRIVVPTSQIFLGEDESLGTEQFDPWTQKTIFEYRRKDVKDGHRIDAELARFFVVQARRHAQRSQTELQRLRNARDLAMSEARS